MSGDIGTTLAHQGGWDEVLFFVVPVLLAVWAVRVMERRNRKAREGQIDDSGQVPDDD